MTIYGGSPNIILVGTTQRVHPPDTDEILDHCSCGCLAHFTEILDPVDNIWKWRIECSDCSTVGELQPTRVDAWVWWNKFQRRLKRESAGRSS